MPAFVTALIVLGAVVGSLITVVADRLPRGESLAGGRSRSPQRWVRHPLAGLGLGTLWAGTYLALGGDSAAELALGLVLCAVLLAVTLTDLDLRLIPNEIVLGGSIVAVVVVAVTDSPDLGERAIAAVAAGGPLFVIALAHPRGMGMGDAKLVAMMGLYLGEAVAPALLSGFAIGALVGAAMIVRHGAAARKRAIPLGPFLALGGVIGLWFGDEIVHWYVGELFSG